MGKALGQVGTEHCWVSFQLGFGKQCSFSCLSRGHVVWLCRYQTDLAIWMLPSLSKTEGGCLLFLLAPSLNCHILSPCTVSVWNSLLWDSLG